MTISVGDAIPSVRVKRVTGDAIEDIDSAEFLGHGTVAVFALPGAFTPTCQNNHLPGYIELADQLHEAGVDKIVCAAANDHHVMKAWGLATGAFPAIEMLADAHAELARAMGLDKDFPDLGHRFRRSSLLVNQGVVGSVTLETASGPVLETGAAALLETIRANRMAESA